MIFFSDTTWRIISKMIKEILDRMAANVKFLQQ